MHLSGCWSPGKIHDCEGPASEVHLFDRWRSVRIRVWPETERESSMRAAAASFCFFCTAGPKNVRIRELRGTREGSGGEGEGLLR